MLNPESVREIKVIKQGQRQTISTVEDINGRIYLKREIAGDKREIYKLLQKIDHPNIPKVYYVGFDDNTTVIEEFVNGEPLSQFIDSNKTLSKKQIKTIAKSVLFALERLHEEKIIHRDVKPANILVSESGHTWLVDYEIARVYRNEVRQDTDLMGTFGYAPIEQYGMMPTDYKTDIYAFGVTLKALLDYSKIKGFLNRVADKCKRLDPAQRYSSAKSVKNAILLDSLKNVLILCVALILVVAMAVKLVSIEPTDENIEPNTEIAEQNEASTQKEDKTDTPKEGKENVPEVQKSEAKPQEENTDFEGDFADFEIGTKESEYYGYTNYPALSVFSTDTPYQHLLFIEDMAKQGRIKLGENSTIINADIELNNGTLIVNLNDGKGNKFSRQFKYNGQHEYQMYYTKNLQNNADIMCYDLDDDGSNELLIGLSESVTGVMDGMVRNYFNYCIAWCIDYDENTGFILCEGDMFSKERPFEINRYVKKLNVMWNNFDDVTGYYVAGNTVIETY